ncbi:Tyrosine-protein kinase [Aphelenchoides besseyi]|nr:Tyrosine-protein kinase [Aphelenchoides besseyi]
MGQKQSTEKSEEKETQSIELDEDCKVDILDQPFYHGMIPQKVAKAILERNESYLVRQANFPNSTSINQLVEWHCSTLTPINDQGAKIRFAIPRPDWRLRAEQVRRRKEDHSVCGSSCWSVKKSVMATLDPYMMPCFYVCIRNQKKQWSRLLNEANNMLGLKHRNIIRIYGIVTHEKNVGVVLEKCKDKKLKAKPSTSEKQKIGYAIDCAEGMAYLADEHTIHRDLAARNILLTESGICKVADFGLSLIGQKSVFADGKIPIRWTAPEALRSREYSSKSDCWSYGVLLFEIFSDGGKVGEGWKREQVKDHVLRGNGWDAPSNTPELYRQIMTACFTFDPQNRCSFAQIRNAIRNNDPDHLLITTNAPERTVSN